MKGWMKTATYTLALGLAFAFGRYDNSSGNSLVNLPEHKINQQYAPRSAIQEKSRLPEIKNFNQHTIQFLEQRLEKLEDTILEFEELSREKELSYLNHYYGTRGKAFGEIISRAVELNHFASEDIKIVDPTSGKEITIPNPQAEEMNEKLRELYKAIEQLNPDNIDESMYLWKKENL